MQPWKPLLAILPAGLLLGLVGGQASRPVMLIEDERPWPQSLREKAGETELGQRAYDDSDFNFYSRGYSYRPDLDYEVYAWPDQTDRSAELLAAEYSYGLADAADAPSFGGEVDLPQTRRAVTELAAVHAARLPGEEPEIATPNDVASERTPTATDEAKVERGGFVLPPVPPPLVRGGDASEPSEPSETEAF